MNLRLLEVFVAVADEGTFARAGELLYLSPSGVSGAIRTLERELGVALFRRHGRGVEISDAGRAFLPEARATLAHLEAARRAVSDSGEGLRGRVRLGIMQALRHPAPEPAALLAAFRRTHPGVEVRVRHGGGSRDMVAQVAAGGLDLALVGAPSAPAAVDLIRLFSEPIDLICAPGHSLSGCAGVGLSDIAGQPFAELPTTWGSRITNDLAFTAHGLERNILHEINDVPSLRAFVAEDLAVALLPRSMADGPGVCRVPLHRDAPVFTISLAARAVSEGNAEPPPSPAVRALADHIAATRSKREGG